MSSSPPHAGAVPWAQGVYSIKQHGVTITNCDQEPVQTPSCIQSHRALLVLSLSQLAIRQVSENSRTHLGCTPGQLLGEHISVLGRAGRGKDSPLVILSTSANPRDLEFCYTRGANAYHTKPGDYPSHLEVVGQILRYWLSWVTLPAA